MSRSLSANASYFPLQGIEATSDDLQIPEQAGVEPEPANDTLVTTRCIKKQQGKRKYSGDGADLNPKPAESPVQVSVRGLQGHSFVGQEDCLKKNKKQPRLFTG